MLCCLSRRWSQTVYGSWAGGWLLGTPQQQLRRRMEIRVQKKRKLQILTSASRVQSLGQTPLLLHCDCGVRLVLGEDGGDGRGLLGADLAEGGSVGSSDWRNFSRYQVRRGLPRRHRRRRGRDSGKSVRARERVSCTLLLQSVGRSKSGRAIKATRKFATAPSQHRWCPKLAAMHSLEQKHTLDR